MELKRERGGAPVGRAASKDSGRGVKPEAKPSLPRRALSAVGNLPGVRGVIEFVGFVRSSDYTIWNDM